MVILPQSPLLSQSFAAGNPDTSSWMRGMTPRGGMGARRRRAEAVARGDASATAQKAAENPIP